MAVVNVTFPGNLAQVGTANDLRSIPSTIVPSGALYLVGTLEGVFEFDSGSIAADDGIAIVKPFDRSALEAGRWVKNADGLARGKEGPSGPADNTYTTLTALLASDPSAKSARLVPQAGETEPAGNFNYVGNAWVRQGAVGIDFDGRSTDAKLRETVSVTDARFGGSVAGDWAPALKAALLASACVRVPASLGILTLRSTITLAGQSLLMEAGRKQLVDKDHTADAFVLNGGSRIIGGTYRGLMKTGRLFVLPSDTGRQEVREFTAETGWIDPIVWYGVRGGSQSVVENFVVNRVRSATDPLPAQNNQADPKYAIVMEDVYSDEASPRTISKGQFNGSPSIFFGGCNVVTATDHYAADIGYSNNSRAVSMNQMRIGNQTGLIIRGAGHRLKGDMLPRITIAPGADNCFVEGPYNSGYPIDSSNNSRNSLTFWGHAVLLVLSSDVSPLGLNTTYSTISRSDSTYHLQFYFTIDNFGPGLTYIGLPNGCFTSCPVEQPGTATMRWTAGGVAQSEIVQLRVLPSDGGLPGRRVQVLRANGSAVSQNNPSGATAVTLEGHLSYSA